MSKDILVLENMKLVENIAKKFYVKNNSMDYEDLVSIGTLGLMEAVDKFDSSKECKFSSYAYIKIKSFILDEIRRVQPISKYSMAKVKNYKNTVELLRQNLKREPTSLEKSKELNLNNEGIAKIEFDMQKLNMVYLDTTVSVDSTDTIVNLIKDDEKLVPSNILEEKEKVEILSNSIKLLKEKEQLVLSLYYYEEFNLKEIGNIMDISESRVSQIHKKAINNLRDNMTKIYKYDVFEE